MSLLRTTRGGKTVDFSLANGGVLLGTAPGCQIVVADPAAAPKHCKIVRGPQGFILTDLTGAGKTLVNGTKIREHILRKGDVVQIGAEKFMFTEAAEPVAAVKAAVSASAPAAGGGGAPPGGPRRRLPSKAPAGPSTGSGPVRKLTAKPGSVARVHKGHETFALPSTTKGRVVALAVAIGLVVIGGILFVISSGTKNSEQIKKAAEADIERLNKLPDTDFQRRYQLVQEILSSEDYQKYAKAVINPLERVRTTLIKQIEQEKNADRDLKPFFQKLKELKENSTDEYNRQAERNWEILNVHWDNYKETSWKARLEEVRNELKDFLEKRGTLVWQEDILKLSPAVQKLIREKNFSAGLILVDKFGKDYAEKDSPQLKTMLDDLRSRLKDGARRHVDELKTEAAGMTSKEEARRKLETAKPFIMGFPDVEKQLDKAIGEYK